MKFVIFDLQFRENVAAWSCFHDRRDVFKEFLERVLRLKEQVSVYFWVLFFFGLRCEPCFNIF